MRPRRNLLVRLSLSFLRRLPARPTLDHTTPSPEDPATPDEETSQLVDLRVRMCWQCAGDVPALNYPSHFCCSRCVRIYWGVEGPEAPRLPTG